jgi:hypothetical protein
LVFCVSQGRIYIYVIPFLYKSFLCPSLNTVAPPPATILNLSDTQFGITSFQSSPLLSLKIIVSRFSPVLLYNR